MSKLSGSGIRFPDKLMPPVDTPLVTAALPEQLVVPLNQSIGFTAAPLVSVGDKVKRGQPVGAISGNAPAASVHAPTSGTVTHIEVRPVTGRRAATCIEIRADGRDEPWDGYRSHQNPLTLPTAVLREGVTEAGIVGLGGAMFPTRIKLNPEHTAVEFLTLTRVVMERLMIKTTARMIRTRASMTWIMMILVWSVIRRSPANLSMLLIDL